MATTSRGALITRMLKVAKKHFKPAPPPKKRTLLETLLFACLVENSPPEDAERVFATLMDEYFDWNEIRVSTVRELAEIMSPLTDPDEAASRFKRTLQSVFESIYDFDLERLKKENIGQAAKRIEKYEGTTPFVVAYVTQHGLGGHAIPINRGLLLTMEVVGVVSEAEARKGVVPGLERSVSKNKGAELSSLLHQLGVEVGRNPYGPTARKLLLEINPNSKNRLPKRVLKTGEPEEAPLEPDAEPKTGKGKRQPAEEPAAAESDGVAKKAKKQSKMPTSKKSAKAAGEGGRKKVSTDKRKSAGQRLSKKKPR